MAGLNRINGSDPIYGAEINNRRVENQNPSETGGFTLPDDKDREGVIYEPSTPKEKPKTLAQTREEIAREERAKAVSNLHTRFDGPGVEVELSSEAVQKASAETQTGNSIGGILRDFFQGIRDFFVSLWTGSDASGAAAGETADSSIAGAADEASDSFDAEVSGEAGDIYTAGVTVESADTFTAGLAGSDTARSVGTDSAEPTYPDMDNDPESIAAFMTDYGGRRLAKNSDLLTQYDRSGHKTMPSASDRRRILQGDGNIRRY